MNFVPPSDDGLELISCCDFWLRRREAQVFLLLLLLNLRMSTFPLKPETYCLVWAGSKWILFWEEILIEQVRINPTFGEYLNIILAILGMYLVFQPQFMVGTNRPIEC